jgi:Ca-activated chloride channel family protein
MTLLEPSRLLLLLLVGALVGLYVYLQHRRRHRAVRSTNLALLRSIAPRRPGWRRHGPAAGVALAMAALIVSLAQPVRQVRVAKESATVMLVLDMSASMQATDVAPSRVQAAIAAAKSFVKDLPAPVRVGLISFDRTTRLIATPTIDHQAVTDGLDHLVLGPGTATGDAIYAALDALAAAADNAGAAPAAQPAGSAIVLLSDGVPTVGIPVLQAAQQAANRGVPVSTIAFGTRLGRVTVQGRTVSVPADPDTMASVAELTSGKFFQAVSAKELRSVYQDIGTRVGYETEQHAASGPFLAFAVFVLSAAYGLALLWNGRLV